MIDKPEEIVTISARVVEMPNGTLAAYVYDSRRQVEIGVLRTNGPSAARYILTEIKRITDARLAV